MIDVILRHLNIFLDYHNMQIHKINYRDNQKVFLKLLSPLMVTIVRTNILIALQDIINNSISTLSHVQSIYYLYDANVVWICISTCQLFCFSLLSKNSLSYQLFASDKYHMKYIFQWKVTLTHFHEVFEHHFCLEKVADWKRCYQHKMCSLCTYVALSNALSKHSNSNCVKKYLKALKSLHAAFLNNKFQYFHSGIL